jgi:predicted transcriptional regulator
MDTRIPVTTRLDASVHERLRLLAFKTRRKKQDLIQQALESYLTQHGV